MNTWRHKAHREIARLCRESYLHMNQYPDGTMRRKHRPYTVPELAEQLIHCLNTDDEQHAKALFVHMAVNPEWRGEYELTI